MAEGVCAPFPLHRVYDEQYQPPASLPPFVPRSDYVVLSGRRYLLPSGEPCFSPMPQNTIRTFRTVFGPVALTTAIVLARTPHNLNYGMRRTLCVRLPGDGGLADSALRATQLALPAQPWYRRLRDTLRAIHSTTCDGYRTWVEDAVALASEAHPKRDMRIRYLNEALNDGILGAWGHTVGSHKVNMKHPEYAKPGKFIRTTVDLGLRAWVLGCGLAKRMKEGLSAGFDYAGFTVCFCPKSRHDYLTHHFNELVQPSGRGHFVFFSDDSCLAVRVAQEVRMFNIDITACDTSHTAALFELLLYITPDHCRPTMERCIEQCRTPMIFSNPDYPEQSIKVRFKDGFMKSGWCFTTMINNLATILLFAGMVEEDDWTPGGLVRGAARAGYLIDEPPLLTNPSHLQFLKHSPVRVGSGAYLSVPNLGPLLRVSGTAYGELSPSLGRTVRERAAAAQLGYIRSAFHAVRTPTLMRLLGAPRAGDCGLHYHSESHSTYAYFDHDTALGVRYSMTQTEMDEFFACIFGPPGSAHHGEWVDRIMHMDYGLPPFSHP